MNPEPPAHDPSVDHVRRRGAPGTRPGTLNIPPGAVPPKIRVFAYGPESFVEEDVARPADLPAYLERWPVVWVNVDGLGDADVLRELGDLFGLHRLALEDVVNVPQRPKADTYPDHLFLVTRQVEVRNGRLEAEQVSLVLGDGFVVTFQERPGDCFDQVRSRIRDGRGRIRQVGPDYLTWALLDAIVDVQYVTLDALGEGVDALQEQILDEPRPELVMAIHSVKRELLTFRRILWPTRDMLGQISQHQVARFTDETRMYLRDCQDHAAQILDYLDNYREVATGLMDVYLNSVSHRMNEIMKVLTVIATIFIPLSFVAGLYGMNFDPAASPWNMPELAWSFGYPYALGVMGGIALAMLLFFRRKGWL